MNLESQKICYLCFANVAIGAILLTSYLYYWFAGVSMVPVVHVFWFFIVSPIVFIIQLIVVLVLFFKKINNKIPLSKGHFWGLFLVLLISVVFLFSYSMSGNALRV